MKNAMSRGYVVRPLAIAGISFALAISVLAQSHISLIPTGSDWNYLDDGTDQGMAWITSTFDDSAWPFGRAPFGYGYGNETTTIGFGPDANNKFVTTYYRHVFAIADVSVITNLLLRAQRDDGVVVYLNGSEAYRNNMPVAVSNLTLATVAAPDNGGVFLEHVIRSTDLRSGANVVAVEIHQAAANSTDTRFDLELIGNYRPRDPHLTIEERPVSEPAPILEYRFNETGILSRSTGIDSIPLTLRDILSAPADLHSIEGGGVSERPDDRAFDNSASITMGFHPGTGAQSRQRNGGVADCAAVESIDGLLSLTLQGWIKCDSGPLTRVPRLILADGGFALSGQATGRLAFSIDDEGAVTANNTYPEVGEWIFFAVTYDGTSATNNVRFYKGSFDTAVSLVGTGTISAGLFTPGNTRLKIGNADVDGAGVNDRPFDGWMDNIRLFGAKTDSDGALTQTQLEWFRTKDVLNLPDAPTLDIQRSEGGFSIIWPVYPGGFVLEASQSLSAPEGWRTVDSLAIQTDGRNVIAVPATGTTFFRLRR